MAGYRPAPFLPFGGGLLGGSLPPSSLPPWLLPALGFSAPPRPTREKSPDATHPLVRSGPGGLRPDLYHQGVGQEGIGGVEPGGAIFGWDAKDNWKLAMNMGLGFLVPGLGGAGMGGVMAGNTIGRVPGLASDMLLDKGVGWAAGKLGADPRKAKSITRFLAGLIPGGKNWGRMDSYGKAMTGLNAATSGYGLYKDLMSPSASKGGYNPAPWRGAPGWTEGISGNPSVRIGSAPMTADQIRDAPGLEADRARYDRDYQTFLNWQNLQQGSQNAADARRAMFGYGDDAWGPRSSEQRGLMGRGGAGLIQGDIGNVLDRMGYLF